MGEFLWCCHEFPFKCNTERFLFSTVAGEGSICKIQNRTSLWFFSLQRSLKHRAPISRDSKIHYKLRGHVIRGLGPIEALTQHQGEQRLRSLTALLCKICPILRKFSMDSLWFFFPPVCVVVTERDEKRVTTLRTISSEPSHITEENEGSEVGKKEHWYRKTCPLRFEPQTSPE